jgi:hypothetical protein
MVRLGHRLSASLIASPKGFPGVQANNHVFTFK